jgi:ferredoxin
LRGVICFYSGSGNTRLACEYLAARVGVEFDLVDVTAGDDVDLRPYDVVGLAASTDFGGMPRRFEEFLSDLPPQDGKPAFVLNTYGLASARTLRELADQSNSRGFAVFGGHSLRMPESYPPMIAMHLAFADQPNAAVLRKFDVFIGDVARAFGALERREGVERRRVSIGLLGAMSRSRPRTTARDDMGEKFVDAELCTECGICARRCPYGAITIAPEPVFDMARCYGCWRCYNQCPRHAIYTGKFRGGPYYAHPSDRARSALSAPGPRGVVGASE